MTRELVLLKIGGSLITDKTRPGSLRRGILKRVAAEVARAAGARRILLGHGSGSFGHAAASRHGLNDGPVGRRALPGIADTQDRAAQLHRLVITALRAAGARPFSLAPSSFLTARAGRPGAPRIEPLERALELGLLPVVFGDVLLDREWGACIGSTETVLLALARSLRRSGWALRRAVWLGATDGVYDRSGRTIRRLEPRELPAVLAGVDDAAGTDVTGGIRLRLSTAASLARLGVTSHIVDGTAPGVLEQALRGRAVGTRVVPAGRQERTHG
jgi:isopentenyl phosphate kinase